jgi:hypothetical protein
MPCLKRGKHEAEGRDGGRVTYPGAREARTDKCVEHQRRSLALVGGIGSLKRDHLAGVHHPVVVLLEVGKYLPCPVVWQRGWVWEFSGVPANKRFDPR